MRNGRRSLAILLLIMLLSTRLPLIVGAEESSVYMDVGAPGEKSASFSVGQQHRWYIRTELPEDWETVSGITILQTLSPALTLDPESVNARLAIQSGEEILLCIGEHWEMTAGSVFVEGGIADRICVSLTPEGLDFLSAYQTPFSQLMVSYKAKINTCASMGTQILGMAQLNRTDAEGNRWIFLSDKAAAAVGGFHILLTDSEGQPLPQGSFMVAREATPEELEDTSVLKEHLDIGEETIAVIYERFYTTEDLSGEKTDIAVTDETGSALCYGLAYGTYYLVQIESIRKDILPSKTVTVHVDEASHLTERDGWRDGTGRLVDRTIRVIGTTLVMPQTGGPGTAAYTASGTAVILCACLLLWYNRKRPPAV